jgi:hypothetical protein
MATLWLPRWLLEAEFPRDRPPILATVARLMVQDDSISSKFCGCRDIVEFLLACDCENALLDLDFHQKIYAGLIFLIDGTERQH